VLMRLVRFGFFARFDSQSKRVAMHRRSKNCSIAADIVRDPLKAA
jgi:hypothetical protein